MSAKDPNEPKGLRRGADTVVRFKPTNGKGKGKGANAGREVVAPPSQPLPNARQFTAACCNHPERTLLVHQGGAFYRWDGMCWPEIAEATLRARLYQYFDAKEYWHQTMNGSELLPFAPNRYKVADLLDALRADAHIERDVVTPSWFGDAPVPADEVVSCRNGLVHWPTRTLLSHSPLYFTHHSVPFRFDAHAPAPVQWLKFLRELWGDDAEMIETLQELFGYLLSGDMRHQKMFLLIGPKRSGKGTIARIIRALLGEHNIAGPTLASIGTNFGLQPLIGKPVAIIADARLGGTTDASVVAERLLSISGEDVLTIDRKNREAWTGQLPARIVVLTNEMPRLSDASGALVSRFIMLPTTVSFFGRENMALFDELCIELPGIFNWSLDGLERLRERGYFRQPHASDELLRAMEALAAPICAFVRDVCQIGPALRVPCARLYEAWRAWCATAGREHPSNEQVFGRDLHAAFPGLRVVQPRNPDGSRRREYDGIGLAISDHDGYARVPPRASCRHCDDEGCDWCKKS
jgi:putative DNA primase/helicase